MKFYPSDWRSDPTLKVCSVAARGLWMEMICIMHEAEPRGFLNIKGNPVTENQLGRLVGLPEKEVIDLLFELESMGVFSRAGKGKIIYSRRMVRDEKKAKTAKKNGKNGGNPRLVSDGKEKEISASVKGGDNTHMPEARSQKPESRKKDVVVDNSAGEGEPVESTRDDLFKSNVDLGDQVRQILNVDESKNHRWAYTPEIDLFAAEYGPDVVIGAAKVAAAQLKGRPPNSPNFLKGFCEQIATSQNRSRTAQKFKPQQKRSVLDRMNEREDHGDT